MVKNFKNVLNVKQEEYFYALNTYTLIESLFVFLMRGLYCQQFGDRFLHG